MLRRGVLAGLMALVAGLLTGCSSSSGVTSRGIALSLPAGYYGGVAWGANGDLYLGYSPTVAGFSSARLYRTSLAGRPANPIGAPLVSSQGCTSTGYVPGAVDPGGNVEVLRTCTSNGVNAYRAAPPGMTNNSILYDPASSTVRELAPLGNFATGPPVWEPGLERGWLSYSSGGCAGIVQVGGNGLVRHAQPTMISGRSWELDDVFYRRGGCKASDGEAELPAVSPQGGQLAFLASPGDVGSSRRGFNAWNLYVHALPYGPVREVTGGFEQVDGSTAYSPNGQFLLLNAAKDGHPEEWIVDMRSGERRPVAPGLLGSVTFSPNGQQFAAVVSTHEGDVSAGTQVHVYTLEHLGIL